MNKVILTPNPYRDNGFQTVRKTEAILQNAGIQTVICLPFEVDRSFRLPRGFRFSKLERELADADMLICFGGDGTILHMAKVAARREIPILGVNIGTMGFLAEVETTALEQLACLAEGNYKLDTRMMLEVTVWRNKEILYHDIGLNDAAITKGTLDRFLNLQVNCDGIPARKVCGDGILIATPTGSTGYNYSACGPIVEPEANVFLITPVCPHEIGSRCICTSTERTISVEVFPEIHRHAYLSVDGGRTICLNQGDKIMIQKSKLVTHLVKINEQSFFDIVAAKFHNNR